jgi:hypothetical protein
VLLIVAWLSAIQLNTDFNEARTVYLTSRGENGAHVPVAAAPRSETPVDGKLVTVRPKATDEVILNPGKGWVLYGLPTWKSPEVLAMGTVGYTRLDWAIIEPEEGKLNWQELDQHITSWAAVGKQSAFGVMCANSHSTRPYVTPKWVFDAGARNRKVELVNPESHNGTPGEKVVPVFDDPIFLQKLRAFVTALGERYDGNSNIAYVDIRSYGNWGEGHMWPFKGDHISADSLKEHISIYTEAFPATQLILPWGERDFEPVYEWAVRQGVGMRRDGICGNGDGAETARALGREPAVFEFFGPYGFLKKTGLARVRTAGASRWRTVSSAGIRATYL